ncbi:laccase-24-like [Oryza brachyantha]|uniref:laccase-24-like n=1 Tax=Oryza brachyantha TaxID=4533 RepID=UPI001ADAADCA|nr:laccase-24-like [Oryza brachyantha]
MARSWSPSLLLLLPFALALAASVAQAAVVEHTFNVGNLSISQLCQPERIITAVNGQLPGPTIVATEGDTVVVHMINDSPYNMTIHWHGIFQRGTPWADGPAMVTQCPVRPGGNYTYRFNVTGQEGTLWWHAHVSFHRATVYGALIIRPRGGAAAYPFPKPDAEEVVVLGEWWNADVNRLHEDAKETGQPSPHANAYTINGKPGDFYNCSDANQTHKFELKQNTTYMLRIINAALNTPLFFKVANHSFTVVAADACYTKPYNTDVVVTSPGQTVDVLLVPDAGVAAAVGGRYYMAVTSYDSAINNLGPPDSLYSLSNGTAIVEYAGAATTAPPVQPKLPEHKDTATAYQFLSNLTALVPNKVPLAVDTHMFVTVSMGTTVCGPEQTRCMPNNGTIFASSMNNASFVLPKTTSMLEAQYSNNATGVYTSDFPDTPPVVFDYTSNDSNTAELQLTTKSTKVKTLQYNTTVQMVLQNTRLVSKESHPMHLHGFNFFVLAQGFGNYNETTDPAKFNLVDPQERNTVAVPTGGWAVIRFVADNPGMWFMHCHFDSHLDFGLGMMFEVLPAEGTSLPAPPPDLPQC